MTKKNPSDRLSYGITILIFGVLFLLDKIGILPDIPGLGNLVSIGVFFLIAGIVFLCTQPGKILGWIFLGVGILLNADLFFGWMQNYSRFIVPIGLIIAGIAMVVSAKKKD